MEASERKQTLQVLRITSYGFHKDSDKFLIYYSKTPITVAARSRTWTVFARSNAEIVGSNPIQGMDVCIVCIYSVCVVLCAGRGLAVGWSPVQGVLPTVYRIKKLKSGQGPTTGCRALTTTTIIIITKVCNNSNLLPKFLLVTSASIVGSL
jgi:hypothetical protein